MAIAGPRPKSDDERERRNAPTFNTSYIKADGRLHGPRLPKGTNWCDRTKEWWEAWRRSAQAMVMTDTDWEFLLETALLHNMLWSPAPTISADSKGGRVRNGAVSATQLAAEIRQRVAKFGATFEDRLKLRMSIVTPQDEIEDEERIASEAADAVGYMTRLTAAAAEAQDGNS